MSTVLPAVAYGAGRGYLVNLASPLTSRLPLGNFADELVLGTAGYFMAKKGRGLVRNAGLAMLTVESASLGSQIVSQFMTPQVTVSNGLPIN